MSLSLEQKTELRGREVKEPNSISLKNERPQLPCSTMRASFVFVSFLVLSAILPSSLHALHIGIQTTGTGISLSKECSRKCESEFCTVPPFLRYGKYCGLLYSGCPGEKPCDDLDACCMKHDACVHSKNDDYLSQECSRNLLNCMANLKKSGRGRRKFKGNKCDVGQVVDVISVVIEAALVAGRYLHRP
ncbi:hypothetical protein MLD38_006461 [Melastoma candidum]|uniref:Uncharacterized protein n=1 Tax=Melastoma candidum TaxID=119954 RepID=A0ACB9RPV4_9MYRT|nr:hypothetical protein MLD38_006461 [Melastoma candidum]